MKIKYVGPSPAVDIIPGYHAAHGHAIEVPDELGRSLCEQDTFEEVKSAKKADPAAKTAQEAD